MPESKPSDSASDSTSSDVQDRNSRLRESISRAYARLLGEQVSKSFTAFTFEEALDAQIERIEGTSTKLRPNLLDRVKKIESEVVDAVKQIKALPPEEFTEVDTTLTVNTKEDPDSGGTTT